MSIPMPRQVLFEGWMLGFRPVGAAAVAEVDADLVPIDAALRGYEAAWDAHVDAWLVIKARARKCQNVCRVGTYPRPLAGHQGADAMMSASHRGGPCIA